MTQEYRLIEVDWLKNMWRPDSFFKNAKSVTFQTMTIPNHYMWLYRDKTILYMVKLTLRLSCAMNFAIYPHDTQECKLQMESCKYLTFNNVFCNHFKKKLKVVEEEASAAAVYSSKCIYTCTYFLEIHSYCFYNHIYFFRILSFFSHALLYGKRINVLHNELFN